MSSRKFDFKKKGETAVVGRSLSGSTKSRPEGHLGRNVLLKEYLDGSE